MTEKKEGEYVTRYDPDKITGLEAIADPGMRQRVENVLSGKGIMTKPVVLAYAETLNGNFTYPSVLEAMRADRDNYKLGTSRMKDYKP
jgi:hypothetical protein